MISCVCVADKKCCRNMCYKIWTCGVPPYPLHLVASDKQQKDHKLTLCFLKATMDSDLQGFSPSFPKYHPYYPLTMECGGLIDLGLSLRTIQNETYLTSGHKHCSNEGDRRKWGYVKVTMDGFVVGRKVCVLDHGGYSTLAHQLEDMFGTQSVSGLKLFQMESEFSLVFRDEEGIWRNAVDVPWKEFVESVERLRITRRNDVILPF
ncbi:PREDICTED: auxin-responsive protein IAA34-like isoform X1 [Camelina sativa]|uniref:Auxin-responsive protein n=2 Tax=Camelina sativa TaxID=90675 RepID=A0ABM0Y7L8_CAMSA|nr:PREDICTED: auxin-responsive protein IAA34-like isoform X1 [Camelina sativa]